MEPISHAQLWWGLTTAGTLAALGAGGLWWSVRRDHRRLRNGFFALLLFFALVDLVGWVAEWYGWREVMQLLLGTTFILSALLVPLLLVANGLTMARREGLRPGNLLPLFLGVGVLATPVVSVLILSFAPGIAVVLLISALLVAMYLSTLLLILFLQSFIQRWRGGYRATPQPDAIVALGSGLINGQLPPLLCSRVDRALAILRQQQHHGRQPLLVLSGGQGPDEPRAEAAAMAEYALQRGVDPARLLVEDKSRTTRENLRFTRELLAAHPAAPQRVLVVTSSYHAARTALLASDLGLTWTVAPARTAFYFVPNAWLREYVAVVTYRPRVNLFAGVSVGLLTLGMLLLYWAGQ
ncbi:YdcF family protein [Buchananella hordeovulneris]|uniref:YdcF family protein n=1 Tax=Buchananella hordeovulneris TaxID=52770 RepID=UPI0026DCC13F|nr:YdcF family protein [Buchananella hordeovulneris]MDO5080862.1 YdcF family protein [Buchananella hordeovulneris]